MVMNISTILAVTGAMLGFLGLAVSMFAIGAVRRWRRRHFSLEASLAALRRELELATSIDLKTGRRVKRIEQECAGLADRVERFELRGTAPSFDQAIDSARRGADPGKLAQEFGLSSSEAELVTRLHGRKKIA
jgi:Protein of unknown function (DUF2802)